MKKELENTIKNNLSKIREFLPRNFVGVILTKCEELGIKASESAVYGVANGRYFNADIAQLILELGIEEKKTLVKLAKATGKLADELESISN